jgi:hypothetical protein
MINMDNTHIYKGISFLLLGYPPQLQVGYYRNTFRRAIDIVGF